MDTARRAFRFTPALKSIRKAKGWTQAQMAKIWGVTINFVSQVENGRRGVSAKKMETLAEKLGIPVSFLYVLADDPRRKPIGTLQEIILARLGRRQGRRTSRNGSLGVSGRAAAKLKLKA